VATADFYIAKNDALPTISATLENADSTIVDLTGGTVRLLVTNADTGVTTTVSGTNGGATGIVTATFPASTAGMFRCKWLVTFGGTSTESFPNNDYFLVQVYDGPVGQILTSRADYQSVRDYLGVTDDDLPDSAIESSGFLPAAEAFILNRLALQTGVPTLTQIMATTSPAVASDKAFLKAAVVYRIAYHFAVGETSAVDTSVTVGPITKDLGGIGASWKDAREESLRDCDQALGSLTGFKRWRVLV
jgi:uncharacterized protein YodC (DUF2158 family)